METAKKRGLLVVSFGTSVNETRARTIDAVEEELRNDFPEHTVYRAWTSGMVIHKLKERDCIEIDTVTQAMERMLQDGITDVTVQPTHVVNGLENERMAEDAAAFKDRFASIRFGTPLLGSEEDAALVIRAVMEEFKDLPKDEALVFMGHGTTHYANTVYAALDYRFKDMGYENVFLGTVEAYPSLETLIKKVRAYKAKRVTLAPFMVVAGEHAVNDLSGEKEDSWRSGFEAAGFEVKCLLKGLGEYRGIRKLYSRHAQNAEG